MKAASGYRANGQLPWFSSILLSIGVITGSVAPEAAGQFTPMSVSGAGVGPIDFSSPPSITNGWGSRSISQGNAGVTTTSLMDFAVSTNSGSIITNQIPTDTGSVYFGNGTPFRWNQAGQFIESRPTGNDYNELLLAMRNDSGTDKAFVQIGYDFGAQFPPGTYSTEDDAGKLGGFRVYYSLSGTPGSWTHMPEFDGTNNLGPRNAAVTLSSPWQAGANFYILWVDDNAVQGSGTPPDIEGPWTIDNFYLRTECTPPSFDGPLAIQPHSVTAEQCRATNLTARAFGCPASYQWYRGNPGTAIPGATTATLAFPNAQFSDADTYFVRASGPYGSGESEHVTLSVSADTEQPTVISAVARADLTNVVVSFSEKMDAGAIAEPSSYHLRRFSGGPDVYGARASISADGKTVSVSFDTPRVPNANYEFLIDPSFTDCAGNQLTGPLTELNEVIAPLKYEIYLMTFEDTQWKYNHEGHDLTWPDWHQRGYDDSSWSNGVSVLDGKTGTTSARTNFNGNNYVNGEIIRTVLPLRFASFVDSNVPCYFFRGHFTLPVSPADVSELHLRTFVDDFDAAWLNDNPTVVHANAGNPLTDLRIYGYSGGVAVGDAAILPASGFFSIDPTNLVAGDNLVSVKLFQQTGLSSDITFAYELVGVLGSLGSGGPTLSISVSGSTVTITWADPFARLYEAPSPGAAAGSWQPVTGAGDRFYIFDAGSAAGQKFYTLRE